MGLKAGDRLVIASHNDGKVKELARLLQPYHIDVVSAKNFNPPLREIEESGSTFAQNASLKAKAAAQETGLSALSDDSGLAVDGLDGAPGVYSARFALRQGKKDFNWAADKIWRGLEEANEKTKSNNYRAAFICALALASPEGEIEIYTGKVAGTIVYPPRGDKGFGYDSIFLPEGCAQTFGEMEQEEKQKLSHRARAFALFIEGALKQ